MTVMGCFPRARPVSTLMIMVQIMAFPILVGIDLLELRDT